MTQQTLAPDAIAARLAEDPDAPALIYRDRTVSRGELDAGATAVASGLLGRGLRPGQRVGVLVSRSPELVMALLGILRAGLVYVPVDGTGPTERAAQTLLRAECAALLTNAPYADRRLGLDGMHLDIDELLRSDQHTTLTAVTGTDSAYVIFTSGSTGVPKGVEVTHANLANLFFALDAEIPLPKPCVWLAITAVTFDIAVLELLWTASRGIPVVLAETAETRETALPNGGAPALPHELILRHGVTAMQGTPTFFRMLLHDPAARAAMARLDLILVGGEALDPTLAKGLKALGGNTVMNMYGPTETTVWSTCWTVPDDPTEIHVGHPVAHTRVYVVDERLVPVPDGEPGELLIGGRGVARGYVKDPDLTVLRFISHPDLEPCGSLYRTGDLARRTPSGDLVVSGRIDNQVKVNGHRIELEEVEAALNSLPWVTAAAASVQQDGEESFLAAYYVARAGEPADERTLRTALAELLPTAMIPAVLASITALPVNTSGKIDRKALPPVRPATGPEADPLTALGACVREATSLLGRQVHADDDFFTHGGNSLLGMRLVSRLRRLHGLSIGVAALHRGRTPRAMADAAVPVPAETAAGPVHRAPVTDGRFDIWVREQMLPGDPAQLLVTSYAVEPAVPEELVRTAFGMLLARHPALRTTYRYEEDVLWAHLLPGECAKVEEWAVSTPEGEVAPAWIGPFDLESEPPARCFVTRSDTGTVVTFVVHHIACDGWSEEVIARDFATALAGGLKQPERDRVYVEPRRSEAELTAARSYWADLLKGSRSLDLEPGDPESPQTGDFLRWTLSANHTRWLGAAAGGDLHAGFLTWLATALRTVTGTPDFCIGSYYAGREDADEDAVGYFVRPVPVRFSGDPDVRGQWLRSVSQVPLSMQDLMGLAPTTGRRPGTPPVFQAAMTYQNVAPAGIQAADRAIRRIEVRPLASPFQLHLEVRPLANGSTLVELQWDPRAVATACVHRLRDVLVTDAERMASTKAKLSTAKREPRT
ncbi:amino acid adenylation domain-containing protein [Streptomyces misionensis]|uniref:Amino acid adenylation domain-containing protein n=1 Tax=Streptomyces misionensis TaxID=67331 RepID=A0A5C6JW69_9ACTN|nr:amino acid adenylation domain-containing protein [Streptomyces misionensis]TWV53490.1 amino acid adenylation domain-containing protein [Streptomyces misionensis]